MKGLWKQLPKILVQINPRWVYLPLKPVEKYKLQRFGVKSAILFPSIEMYSVTVKHTRRI